MTIQDWVSSILIYGFKTGSAQTRVVRKPYSPKTKKHSILDISKGNLSDDDGPIIVKKKRCVPHCALSLEVVEGSVEGEEEILLSSSLGHAKPYGLVRVASGETYYGEIIYTI